MKNSSSIIHIVFKHIINYFTETNHPDKFWWDLVYSLNWTNHGSWTPFEYTDSLFQLWDSCVKYKTSVRNNFTPFAGWLFILIGSKPIHISKMNPDSLTVKYSRLPSPTERKMLHAFPRNQHRTLACHKHNGIWWLAKVLCNGSSLLNSLKPSDAYLRH